MLFVQAMHTRKIYSFAILMVVVFSIWAFTDTEVQNEDFSERVKTALREVGHQLLLTNLDSTSLVLPVVAVDESKYRLTFQTDLQIQPGSLVSLVKDAFQKAALPLNYRVEVVQCEDGEVAYSYELKNEVENDIIPCAGRNLPKNCYTIEVKFIEKAAPLSTNRWGLVIIVLLGVVGLIFLYSKRTRKALPETYNSEFSIIGSFQFYPDQNKLVKKAVEINLSRKECELLALFVASPNQIITRDELTKKVWEDNGVFVGRSLDTYISKLRKKLQGDTTIKLTNVHGVGYKLEIN